MQKLPHIAGIAFAVIFGLTFMFSKTVLDSGLSPIGLIAYRYLIAWIAFELFRRFKIVSINLNKDNLKPLIIVGVFQPILYFLFETYGLARTTSAEAGMMIALIPIFATILSAIILKEKPKLIQVFFIILSVSGVIFIQVFNMRSGLEIQVMGLFLLLLAVLSAAFFNIASRNASKAFTAKEITYFMMLMGAVSFNVIYIFSLLTRGEIQLYVTNLFAIELILPLLFLGVVASIGAFFLVNYALSKLEVHISSIYANLSTIIAVLAGAVFLNERIYYYHYIGALMIVVGVYGTVQFNRKNKRLKSLQ